MARAPTVKQMRLLAVLADPRRMLISSATREWRALMRRGCVVADDPTIDPENGLRITPSGLRALADALEKHGYEALRDTGGQA